MMTNSRSSQAGSALVVTLIISAILGSILGSYLVLISGRNQGAMRAMAWNSAVPVLEAGIEEALTHLHEDMENPTANDWNADVIDGQTVYWKFRLIADGSYYYVTNVNVNSRNPVIYSAGYVREPLSEHKHISRLVRVTTTNPPAPFNLAIAAKGQIKLNGAAIVDGYNSALGPYSMSNRNANGGVGTDSQEKGAIDVTGSGHIYGMAYTGPGGTVSVAGGSVGDFNQVTGIQPGWTNDNMNVQFQTNSVPTAPTITPMPTSINGSNVTYLTADGSKVTYRKDNLLIADKSAPLIVTGTNCTLWVPGNFNVIGDGYVYIAPGASLKLIVGGTASISGGGVINGSGVPANFSYIGLSSNTALNYSGHADFVGTINAPEANVGLSGGASLYGAIICNTFTSSGASGVHYDQAVVGRGMFLVTSWREL